MPVTTILRHATERETPVTTEAGSDTRMSNNEGNAIPDHTPLLVESNVDSTESRSPKIPRASRGQKTATAILPSSSPQSKQPRKASASKRQEKSSLSSTQIASETNYYTLATEEPFSTETLSLGASFFAPLGMSNGMFNGMFNSMEGAWEPRVAYMLPAPAPLTNWATENPFPNAYIAAEEASSLYDHHSTTASPSTNQSNSEQRSSFASSTGQISPASFFTAHPSPMGYRPSQTTPEDSATTTARSEQLPDEYPRVTYSLQHMNQQAVTSFQEEEGALQPEAAARLAEISRLVVARQPVPTTWQVPPAQEKVISNPPTSSPSRPALRSSSPTHPVPEMNQSSESPNTGTDMITRSQSRSAVARQRAKNEWRRRAASQSAASQNAEDSSVAASVPVAVSSQVAISTEPVTPSQAASSSRTASSFQAASSSRAPSSSRAASFFRAASSSETASFFRAASSSETASSSQRVPPQENSSRAAEALQRAHQRRLAEEATRQLNASQPTISPYFTNNAQHIPSQSAYPSNFPIPFSSNYHGPSPALSSAQFARPQFPEPGQQGPSYGSQGVHDPSLHNGQATRRGSLGDDVQVGSQEAWQAAERRALSRARSMAPSSQQNAAQRPPSHTPSIQGRAPSQAYYSYEGPRESLHPNAAQRPPSYTPSIQGRAPSQAYSYEGPRESLHPNAAQRSSRYTPSVQGQTPSAQRLESSTPGSRRQRLSSTGSDEVMRNRRLREPRLRMELQNSFDELRHHFEEAESRAENAETRAQEAQAQIQAQATYPPTLPVLEPRIRILIPVCVSGRSLVPPPNQTLEIAVQVQEPMLVEGREARP